MRGEVSELIFFKVSDEVSELTFLIVSDEVRKLTKNVSGQWSAKNQILAVEVIVQPLLHTNSYRTFFSIFRTL